MTPRPPETIDEIPWDGPEGPPGDELHPAAPRKCRHPRDRRQRRFHDDGQGTPAVEYCGACGHVFDPERQRRGKNVRKYGKKAELHAARRLGLEPRGTSRDPEDAGGAGDPAVLQSKTGPGFASAAWIRELEALEGVAVGRPRILLAAEKPGRGSRKGGDRNARRLVVMFEPEFQRLTGLDARRKLLEAVAGAAAALNDAVYADAAGRRDPLRAPIEAWKRLDAALLELRETSVR